METRTRAAKGVALQGDAAGVRPMGMTIIEKILARRAGLPKVAPGDLVVVEVDIAVLIDNAFIPSGWREVLHVAHPERVVVVFDHRAPAPDRAAAAAHRTGREFAKRFGITRVHDVARDAGISHVVVAEQGYARPGTVLICADSHTCSSGAFNCAARGVGAPDMLWAVTTGETWFRLGDTVRYDFTGKLAAGVTAKDVFLHISQTHGAHTNQNVEFGGAGLAHLSINARRTIATMAAELSAEFATFEADDVLLDYVRARTVEPFEAQAPDPDASYRDRRTIALDRMEPLVALPDSVINNSVPVGQVAGERIDQAFIGSCANGTLDDLALAAKVLQGKRVAPSVRLIV